MDSSSMDSSSTDSSSMDSSSTNSSLTDTSSIDSSSMDSSLTSNEEEHESPQTRSNNIDDEQGVIDKSRDDDQRTAWNKLHVLIGYLVYKVNAVNIGTVKKELLQHNMIRGKHMFCRFITSAQHFSTANTHVYATLVAVINLVLPEIGKLVLKKCISLFQCAAFGRVSGECSSSVMFIGQLINHGVADEKLAIDILTHLLEQQSLSSINRALELLEICGKKISKAYKDILDEVLENMLNFLKNKRLNAKGKNVLKRILKLQENGFKHQQLDLVPDNECQITHYETLEPSIEFDTKISYHYDPKFEFHEQMYKNLILKSQGYDSEEENGLESITDFNNQYDGEKELIKVMKHINDIEKDTNMLSLRKVCLRKLINLTYLMTDYTELVQQIVKYCQVAMDLINMIIDCCCEHSTYENHFGNLTKLFTETDERFAVMLDVSFIHCYVTSDKFDSHRTQIVSSYFVHLLELGLIPCKLLSMMAGLLYATSDFSTFLFQTKIIQNKSENPNDMELQPKYKFSPSTTEIIYL